MGRVCADLGLWVTFCVKPCADEHGCGSDGEVYERVQQKVGFSRIKADPCSGEKRGGVERRDPPQFPDVLAGGHAGENRAQRIDREKQQDADHESLHPLNQPDGQPRQNEHDGENRAAGDGDRFFHGSSPFVSVLSSLYHKRP